MKMKYLNINLIFSLLLCIIFFSSCEKDEFVTDEVIDVDMSVPDTIIIDSEFSYRFESGELQRFNGLGASCLNEDSATESYINFIAYGEDLRIVDNEAIYDEDVFTIFWLSDSEAELGEFSAFGNILKPDGTEITTIVRINILSFERDRISGELTGTFKDPVSGDASEYEGVFNLERYDCDIIADDLPDIEEEDSIVEGTLDVIQDGENLGQFSSIALSCINDIFEDLEGTKYFQISGGEFIIDEDGEVETLLGLNYLMYHREQDPLVINKTYEVAFGEIDDDTLDNLNDGGEAYIDSFTSKMDAVYTKIDGDFLEGYVDGELQDGSKIRAEFRSQKIDCD